MSRTIAGSGTVLTPEDHEHFLEHGYVVIGGLVPREMCEAAVAALEAGSYEGQLYTSGYSPPYPEEAAACITPDVLRAAAELLGGADELVWDGNAKDLAVRQQPDEEWRPYHAHADLVYPTLTPDRNAVLNCFVFLTTVPPRSGAFVLYPGSANRYRAFVIANGPDALWGATDLPEMKGEFREMTVQPGDVVLYQHIEGHSASPNVENPQARHALRTTFGRKSAVTPGARSFDEMSTIDKANSARYMRHRYGETFALPEVAPDERTDRALAEGFSPSGGVVAQSVVRVDGWTEIWAATGQRPEVIVRLRSRDWVNWEHVAEMRMPTPVRSLHIDRRFHTILSAGLENGRVALKRSENLDEWTDLTELDGRAAHMQFVHGDNGAKAARQEVCLYVVADHPTQMRWTSGSGEAYGAASDDASTWTISGTALTSAVGDLCDVEVRSSRHGFTLVADIAGKGPHVAVSEHMDEFTEELQPLAFDAPSTPSSIRVFYRAEDFWLVTYLRDGRVFWGTIDWPSKQGLLEIRTASALVHALERVGLL